MTNYEKITSMSIKELATFLKNIEHTITLQPWYLYYFAKYCLDCPYGNSHKCEEVEFNSQYGCTGIKRETDSIIGEWLKAEVDELIK